MLILFLRFFEAALRDKNDMKSDSCEAREECSIARYSLALLKECITTKKHI
jgi:hypothetical protein